MLTNEMVGQPATLGAVRVLVMADSPRFFDRVTRHLQQACGWSIDRAPATVITPHADQTALRHDIIVVDARAGVAGIAPLIAAMHTAYAHQELPPVVVAAVHHTHDGQAALHAGADGYVRARALPEDVAHSIAQMVAYRTLHQAAKLAEARAAHLKAIHDISKTINAATDLRPILDATCRAAVELFGVDHSGLVLFDHDTGRAEVRAEYPDYNCRGLVISIHEAPFEERIVNAPEPLAIDDVAQWPEADLGPVAVTFRHLGIRSILIVPIVCDGKTQGSFSLDWIGRTGVFPPYVRELCSSIAEQVAIALTKTRLLTESKQRIARRDELRRRTLAVTAQLDQQHVLQTVVREAAALLKTRSAGLYLYDPIAAQLRLAALHGLPTVFLGRTLRRGEGMAGQLLTNNKPYDIIANYRTWSGRADIYADDCPYEAVLGAPLLAGSRTIGVLFVEDQERRNFNEHDGGYLRLFADAATVALEKAELFEQRHQLLRISETLRTLGAAMQEQHDLDAIGHIVLTGATANYALRFPRAALLLLSSPDEAGKRTLDVQMAIGHLTEAAARADWEKHPDDEPDALERYLARSLTARRIATPLDAHLAGLRMPFDLAANDAFAQACREARVLALEGDDLVQVPASFSAAFDPAAPLLVAPLMARGRPLGLLVADAKFQSVLISDYQREALGDLAGTAALAIDNTSLLREAQVARDQLLSLFEASSALIDSTEPQRVLEDIVFRAKVFTNAMWVSIFIVDVVHGSPIVHGLVSTRKRPTFDPNQVVRPDGVTMQVLTSKLPFTFEDTSLFGDQLHPLIFREGVGAAICLPLVRREQAIGVMWIHCRQARRFSEMERMALRLFVNQAVIAYDKAQQFEDRELMRRAIGALAHIDRGDDARQRVVRQAGIVLRAQATVLWIYDADSRQFLPGLTRTWNIPADQWEQSFERAPRRSGTAFRMLTQRWLGVQDVQHGSDSAEIGESTRDVMERIGARSVQIINVQHGNDSLGVLYAFYTQPRAFDDADKAWATTFAGYAAQTLTKAALLEQVSVVRDAAELVASVSVRENIEMTLNTVAGGVRRVLGSDMIEIYGYDPASETPIPMLTQEASGSDLTWENGLVDDSVIEAALRWRSTRVFPRVLNEPLLARARFVQRLRLESLAICPLRVAGEYVGVLIVGYCNPHRFSSVEEHTLDLFANQGSKHELTD